MQVTDESSGVLLAAKMTKKNRNRGEWKNKTTPPAGSLWPRPDHEADSCGFVYFPMPPTMRVVMFWIILIIEFGLPSLYNTLRKAYEFLKSLLRPFRGKSHRSR